MPYSSVVHSVVETPQFIADIKSAHVPGRERDAIVDTVAGNPTAGDVMSGTGGARKLRFAGRGWGKSGGYRVITFYAGEGMPVFLLALYGKGERANLTKAERNTLRTLLSSIVETYRKGKGRNG